MRAVAGRGGVERMARRDHRAAFGHPGLLVGVYLAYRYSIPASRWLGSEGMTGQAAGFLLVFGLVLVALALLGRLMRGLFKFAGLGLFDQLGAPRSGL